MTANLDLGAQRLLSIVSQFGRQGHDTYVDELAAALQRNGLPTHQHAILACVGDSPAEVFEASVARMAETQGLQKRKSN